MAKYASRPTRWSNATSAARDALAAIEAAYADLASALSDLSDLVDEYGEWRDNLPEFSQGSALADKLDEMANLTEYRDLDVEPDLSEFEQALDEAEAVDLPRGFGRD